LLNGGDNSPHYQLCDSKISFEQAIVANATGMSSSARHAGIQLQRSCDQMTNMYDVEQLKEWGGIVDYVVGSTPGRVYSCLQPDDLSSVT